ncbi:thiopeptide-type bacteriocin biosynthesis protein [Paenibacillus sp. JX-17]|uniref:Thiopeptide-type bacteriocin biosynthesis protein n=1 Tax=Paenibacillus lacisoli TaxID=3064525 RepID=A0ABT9CF74_9BACL|nr:thiopeptide-type bacteriocin biosynthesis protein [Paenibacillus sp. JX-17]MDO7907923.1 thiopeptide-type bacteriocin biosynthesis protein [Paenibacillus sp. JX-17]
MLPLDWVHYHVYPGSLVKLDNGVESVIAPVVKLLQDQYAVKQWFFIRYFDRSGAHLKLRFQVKQRELKEFLSSAESGISSHLAMIESEKPLNHQRLIPYRYDARENIPKYTRNIYEPELTKYINDKYLSLSENLFCSSSELVCMLMKKINSKDINRYEWSLILTERILMGLALEREEITSFHQTNLDYWSGSPSMSSRLREAAYHKRDVIDSMMNPQQVERTDSIQGEDAYVTQTVSILKEAEKEYGRSALRHLLFHYSHMMNNRLGIWPIEEAYLSALMLQHKL